MATKKVYFDTLTNIPIVEFDHIATLTVSDDLEVGDILQLSNKGLPKEYHGLFWKVISVKGYPLNELFLQKTIREQYK